MTVASGVDSSTATSATGSSAAGSPAAGSSAAGPVCRRLCVLLLGSLLLYESLSDWLLRGGSLLSRRVNDTLGDGSLRCRSLDRRLLGRGLIGCQLTGVLSYGHVKRVLEHDLLVGDSLRLGRRGCRPRPAAATAGSDPRPAWPEGDSRRRSESISRIFTRISSPGMHDLAWALDMVAGEL